jgi:hypothetical protein
MILNLDNNQMSNLQTRNRATGESHPSIATTVRTQPAIRAQHTVKKSAAGLKGIEKLRQLNKKKMDAGRNLEEEEAKHKKNEEGALKKAEDELAKITELDDVAKNLQKIMNGATEDEEGMNVDVDKEEVEQSL